MYTLIFENSHYQQRTVMKHLPDIEHCEMEIAFFCKERNYTIPYMRTWVDNEKRVVYDVGSHSEFFYCVEEHK